MQNVNIVTIFLTGLLTGGLTCMAVQGGLLAATLAQSEEERLQEKAKGGNALPILAFLTSKLAAYTLLGFLLGLLGSFFQLSIQLRVFLQIAVSIFMIGTALNILQVHPIFRYFVIQPPKFLTRIIRKQTKNTTLTQGNRLEKDLVAPGILGAFTIFIPCGTTQAMMALAVAAGNPLLGAVVMFAFILGTSPVFFILGYFATKLGDIFQEKFMKLAAIAIVLLALFNISNALTLSGVNITIGDDPQKTVQTKEPTVTKQTITIGAVAYTPNSFSVKSGSTVTIHLQNKDGASCIQAFTIPQLGIQKVVPVGQSSDVTFTVPDQPTKLKFMCSMGMYQGVINVI